MPGPPPVPTAIRILRGNPSKRPLNKNEPMPGEFKHRVPDHLNDEGKKEWKRLVAILKRMRVLTEADYMVVANAADVYSMICDASRQLKVAGILYKGPSGYIQTSPLMGIITRNISLLKGLLSELGLTPASRSRLQVQPERKPVNKWADLG